jgi:predicted secreted protein
LYGANLHGANLRGANLPIFNKWAYSINLEKQEITIGCKTKDIKSWDLFFASKEEYSTSRSSEEFKFIEATYLASKAYMQHLLKE